jgi:hypothetical protein
MRNNSSDSDSNTNTSTSSSTSGGGTTSALVESVDQMVKLPFQMTGATWDFMMQGVRNLTGTSSDSSSSNTGYSSSTNMGTSSGNTSGSGSSSSWTGSSSSNANTGSSTTGITSTITGNNQDLSGDDLKYVVWSIVFTKPGYECVLEQQQSEIVNYSADPSTFAGLKIAKFLEKARHGRAERTSSWVERNYPPEPNVGAERRTEVSSSSTGSSDTTVVSSTSAGSNTGDANNSSERGYRIPNEDQKFITFIYRVDWRLPKQEEAVRVERVTIERGTTTTARM